MQPLQQPGLYHQMRRAYFDRVEAIEFTVAHDDGKRVEDLPKAEIVLLGLSRVGKTPLSMYSVGPGVEDGERALRAGACRRRPNWRWYPRTRSSA
jgi:hypothetical protein